MDQSKECRAGFDKITKGLEKQGYTDWKNWVLKQVENYTDEQLQNLIKRTEIKLEIADEDRELTAPDLLKEYLPFITILPTIFVTYVVAAINSVTTIYNSYIDEAHINEYADLIRNMAIKLFGQALAICAFCAIIYILSYTIEKFLNRKVLSERVKTRVYYRELLEILREKQESHLN